MCFNYVHFYSETLNLNSYSTNQKRFRVIPSYSEEDWKLKRYLISAGNKANYLGPEGFLFEQLLIWPSLGKPLIIMTILKYSLSFTGWTTEVIT